jgi:hypothetical protein
VVVRSDVVVICQVRICQEFMVFWQHVVVVRQEGKSDGEPASAAAAVGR